jgi:hypothetical protein
MLPCSHTRAFAANKSCTGGRSARTVDAFTGCFANQSLINLLLPFNPRNHNLNIRSVSEEQSLGSALPCLPLHSHRLLLFRMRTSDFNECGTCTAQFPPRFGCSARLPCLCVRRKGKKANEHVKFAANSHTHLRFRFACQSLR